MTKQISGKSNYFGHFAWRTRNFSEIYLEKSGIFFTGIHDPQISNQIDAAGPMRRSSRTQEFTGTANRPKN